MGAQGELRALTQSLAAEMPELLASLVPALKAAGTDPMETLSVE